MAEAEKIQWVSGPAIVMEVVGCNGDEDGGSFVSSSFEL